MELWRALRTYLFLSLVCFLLVACRQGESTLPFDPHIEDLKLVKLVQGEEALEAINRLHGMPIEMFQGFIAHYEGGYGKATIWVSEAPTEDLAEQQIQIMIDKMKKNRRSPFSGYKVFDAQGLKVIAFDGMGQLHYVFRGHKWVYWVSGDRRQMDNILEHIQRTG